MEDDSFKEISNLDFICAKIGDELGFPLFVKPANCGSSIGINKATNIETLKEAISLHLHMIIRSL